MIAIVDDARGVIKIDQQRLAIAAGFRLDDEHGGTGGAEIDLVARRLHVVLGVAPVQDEIPGATGQRVLDQAARNAQPALGIHEAAARRHRFDAGRDRLAKPDGFQKLEGSFVDAPHVVVGERLVLAADHAWTDCCIGHGNGAGPQGLAGFTATAAAGKVLDCAHLDRLLICASICLSAPIPQRSIFLYEWLEFFTICRNEIVQFPLTHQIQW